MIVLLNSALLATEIICMQTMSETRVCEFRSLNSELALEGVCNYEQSAAIAAL